MKRVLILVNPEKPGAREMSESLCPWLADRAAAEVMDLGPEPIAGAPDLVVVLGGDGSILRAARMLGGREIPVVGINLGKLGYLAEFSADAFREQFADILAGRAHVSRRLMLSARCERAGGPASEHLVLNDVIVAGGESHRMVGVAVSVDGEAVTTYYGDGVIVSTPTGSTAYGLGAGGPILAAGLEAMVIVPICPHSLTHRPIVLRPDCEVVLVPGGLQKEAVCVADGQEQVRMSAGDRLVVRRASASFLLVQRGRQEAFATLSHKLHWGHGPKYGA